MPCTVGEPSEQHAGSAPAASSARRERCDSIIWARGRAPARLPCAGQPQGTGPVPQGPGGALGSCAATQPGGRRAARASRTRRQPCPAAPGAAAPHAYRLRQPLPKARRAVQIAHSTRPGAAMYVPGRARTIAAVEPAGPAPTTTACRPSQGFVRAASACCTVSALSTRACLRGRLCLAAPCRCAKHCPCMLRSAILCIVRNRWQSAPGSARPRRASAREAPRRRGLHADLPITARTAGWATAC